MAPAHWPERGQVRISVDNYLQHALKKLVMLHRSDFEVLFPKDIETDCLDKISQFDHPTGDLYPKIFDDDCEQVGISFEDTRYGNCPWCMFQKSSGCGNSLIGVHMSPDQTKRYKDTKIISWRIRRLDSNKYRSTNSRYCTFRYLKITMMVTLPMQIIKVINKNSTDCS